MTESSAIQLNTLLQLVGRLDDSDDPGSVSQRFRLFLKQNVRSGEARGTETP